MFATAHLRSSRRDRAILAATLLGLAAIAWLALWAVDGSPYARYLQHDTPVDAPLVAQVGLFTAGWLVMIVAMMLPSSVPLVLTFGAIVGRRPRPGLLTALLVAGYALVWTAFGFGAWMADRGVHAAVDAWPWLAAHPQLIMALTLGIAGLWQFSPLRDRCLDECRSPLGFVMNRWRGSSPERESLAMGIAHGAFCVGCCWSIMLVMFGIGMSSLGAMLAIGALTAIEKNLPWGRRMTRPLGVLLILAGVYTLTP
jgi:predicted metal-binding membrane protein